MDDIILVEQDKIEFHYFFSDDSHSMNARILHTCNTEILGIINKLSDICDIDFQIETIALEEGGIKQIWHFLGENSSQITMILSFIMVLLMLRPANDKDLIDLQKENLKLKNEKLELEIKDLKNKEIGDKVDSEIIEVLNIDHDITLHRSRYYENLEKEEKITKVETISYDSSNNTIEVRSIEKKEFIYYIKYKEDLSDIIDNEATIKIIAPVLLNKKLKWKGMYKNQYIDFYMNDKEFKKEIEMGSVIFKSGSVIQCILVVKRKRDEVGIEYITSYAVRTVLSVYIGSQEIVTLKGKIHKIVEKEKKDQLALGFTEDYKEL